MAFIVYENGDRYDIPLPMQGYHTRETLKEYFEGSVQTGACPDGMIMAVPMSWSRGEFNKQATDLFNKPDTLGVTRIHGAAIFLEKGEYHG